MRFNRKLNQVNERNASGAAKAGNKMEYIHRERRKIRMRRIYNVGRNIRGMHSGRLRRGYGCDGQYTHAYVGVRRPVDRHL